MPRKLYLLRHADALPIEGNFEADLDFERRLSEKGLAQCARLKKHLLGLRFDKVLCSAAKRTIETYQNAVAPAPIETRQDFYNATEAALLRGIRSEDAAEHLLLIAHNPGISDLARILGFTAARSLPTCGFLSFNINGAWQEAGAGSGAINAFYAP